jgi:hypothetical protein
LLRVSLEPLTLSESVSGINVLQTCLRLALQVCHPEAVSVSVSVSLSVCLSISLFLSVSLSLAVEIVDRSRGLSALLLAVQRTGLSNKIRTQSFRPPSSVANEIIQTC